MASLPLYARPAHGLLVLQEEEPEPSEEDESEFDANLSPDAHVVARNTADPNDGATTAAPTLPGSHYPGELSDDWRFQTSSQTVGGVLFICLNIGVDPPDAERPAVCARMQSWFEPDYTATAKSLNEIKSRLCDQYKQWLPKGRFRACGDPTLVDLHKHCKAARKNAKHDRVLYHYNGHGVPMPTDTGEIWLFNSTYTKYIPINLLDLQQLVGNPAIYVFDCNAAGKIINFFRSQVGHVPFVGEEHLHNTNSGNTNGNGNINHNGAPYESTPGHDTSHVPLSQSQPRSHTHPQTPDADPDIRNAIVLVSCSEIERLPVDEKLPADLFTACLTTPIRTALYCYASRSLVTGITPEMIDSIPGTMYDRDTPLSDLARIFTTISDTIAWSVLPRHTFKRLFREDLLLASMMRNFLLACRIMRMYGCTPQSIPQLPDSHNHPLWDAFDYAMEQYLAQLPSNFKMLKRVQSEREFIEQYNTDAPYSEDLNVSGIHKASLLREESRMAGYLSTYPWYRQTIQPGYQVTAGPVLTHDLKYEPSTFFEDQIKAFEVWLDMADQPFPPQQLPILLLLLTQPHYRKKGLQLLSSFLEIGRKAVEEALLVGVFPYILSYMKANYSNAAILPELVLIWGKILAFDPKCIVDLASMNAHHHFVDFLQTEHDNEHDDNRSPVHLAVAFFIVSIFGTHSEENFAVKCQRIGIREICLKRLHHEDPLVRRWACLCLTQILHNGEFHTVSDLIHVADGLECVLRDGTPDVRAAGVSAIAEVLYRALEQKRNNQQAVVRRLQPTVAGNINANVSGNVNSTPGSYGRLVQGEYPSAGSPQAQESRTQPPLRTYNNRRNQTSPDTAYNAFSFPSTPPRSTSNKPTPKNAGNTSIDMSSKTSLENKLVDQIGRAIAHLGLINSSVLVRREVAIALSHAAMINTEPFLAAAKEFPDITKKILKRIRGNQQQLSCFSEMWLTLFELALDPHPVVASHARASFDMINSQTPGGGFSTSEESSSSTQGEALESPFGSFNPSNSYPIAGVTNANKNHAASENRSTPTADGLMFSDGMHPPSSSADGNSNVNSITRHRRIIAALGRDSNPNNRSTPFGQDTSRHDVIHVRGSSGTFNLNSVAPRGRIPRVNSASVINLNDACGPEGNSYLSTSPRHIKNASSDLTLFHNHLNSNGNSNRDDESLALSPKFHLIASLMNLFQISKPPQSTATKGIGNHNRQQITSSSKAPSQFSNGLYLPDSNNTNVNINRPRSSVASAMDPHRLASPPRVQRRSRSYQVLPPENSVLGSLSVSYEREDFHSTLRRIQSSEVAGSSGAGNELNTTGIYKAERQLSVEKAVDSLFSWSCACMSKISVESTGPDHMPEPIPEIHQSYFKLWDAKLRRENEQYLSSGQSSLLNQLDTSETQLEEQQNSIVNDSNNNNEEAENEYEEDYGEDYGTLDDEDDINCSGMAPNITERSTHFMGAGGGAVVSLAFLPKEIGREGDEYIVTGDSTGSVGVYDTQTGECQSCFGIPGPPGIPDVEVRSVLCLNGSNNSNNNVMMQDTPLILAGSYDGRVAVFRPNLVSKKYAVLSSFQASGRSLWTNFKRTQAAEEEVNNTSKDEVRDEYDMDEEDENSSNNNSNNRRKMKTLLHKSGNGLVMDFQTFNHSLYAAGCERNVLRVWDLDKEMCSWEGGIASKDVWPTAICSPPWAAFHTVVVGASDGSVTLIDTRTRTKAERLSVFGRHEDPIVAVAYGQWVGEGKGESIVSADCEGCIKLWDPRAGNGNGNNLRSEVKAHDTNLTAMAAHDSGNYIATGSTDTKCVKVFRAKLGTPEMITHRTSAEALPGIGERMAPVTGLALRREPCQLAVGCSDSTVTLFDLE